VEQSAKLESLPSGATEQCGWRERSERRHLARSEPWRRVSASVRSVEAGVRSFRIEERSEAAKIIPR